MIVAGMNEDQLLSEVRADYIEAFHISDLKNQKVRRLILKSSIFPLHIHSLITTTRRNKWILFWESHGKKYRDNNCLFHCVCYYDSEIGKYAVFPTFADGRMILLIFTPHFFSRYAQRNNISLTGVELIKRFFEKNRDFCFGQDEKILEGCKAENHCCGSTDEGVALGLWSVSGDIILFRTFITYEMSKGEQVDLFNELNQTREEKHKEHIKI